MSARERGTLLLAARQLAGPMIEPIAQATCVRIARPGGDVAVRVGNERRRQHVLEDRALRQERMVLEDEADSVIAEPRLLALAERERVLAVEGHRAGRGASSAPRIYRSVLLPLPEGP